MSSIGVLRVARKVDRVATEVTTINGSTLAMLGDATETRRIDEIPVGDRTVAEQHHIEKVNPEETP